MTEFERNIIRIIWTVVVIAALGVLIHASAAAIGLGGIGGVAFIAFAFAWLFASEHPIIASIIGLVLTCYGASALIVHNERRWFRSRGMVPPYD